MSDWNISFSCLRELDSNSVIEAPVFGNQITTYFDYCILEIFLRLETSIEIDIVKYRFIEGF